MGVRGLRIQCRNEVIPFLSTRGLLSRVPITQSMIGTKRQRIPLVMRILSADRNDSIAKLFFGYEMTDSIRHTGTSYNKANRSDRPVEQELVPIA